jgi:uncharacterized membrane protein (DUF373 family)
MTMDRKKLADKWMDAKLQWSVLTFYQRFETAVALALTVIISAVILVALYRLTAGVAAGLVFGALNPLEHKIFQQVFGEIMTLLIALEFNHTLQYVVKREQSIIQTKTVLLIALLALARKFIILDLKRNRRRPNGCPGGHYHCAGHHLLADEGTGRPVGGTRPGTRREPAHRLSPAFHPLAAGSCISRPLLAVSSVLTRAGAAPLMKAKGVCAREPS